MSDRRLILRGEMLVVVAAIIHEAGLALEMQLQAQVETARQELGPQPGWERLRLFEAAASELKERLDIARALGLILDFEAETLEIALGCDDLGDPRIEADLAAAKQVLLAAEQAFAREQLPPERAGGSTSVRVSEVAR